MNITKKSIGLWSMFFSAFLTVSAGFPPGSLLVEAEDMTVQGTGWETKDYTNLRRLYVSGGAFLNGSSKGDDKAVVKLECPKSGDWHIWIRYVDQPKRKNEIPFAVETVQGAAVHTGEFDGKTLIVDAQQIRTNTSEMKWAKMETKLEQGPFELILKKTNPLLDGYAQQRSVDCFLITPDKDFIPTDDSFFPLYMQLESNADATFPQRFVFHIRKSDGKYFHEHNSLKYPTAKPVTPGSRSEWVDISQHFSLSNRDEWNKLLIRAFKNDRGENPPAASFTVYFSTTKSMDGLVRKFERKGAGNAAAFLLKPEKDYQISTEIEESAKNLKRSANLQTPGKKPVKFPFSTNAPVGALSDETLTAELKALGNLGINSVAVVPEYAERFIQREWPRANVSFYAWSFQKRTPAGYCPKQVDWQRLRENIAQAEKNAKSFPPGIQVTRYANLADEPGHHYRKHLLACDACRKEFPAYLKTMKVPFDELRRENPSLSSIEEVKPLFEPEKPVLFYWSSRYGMHSATDFLAKTTAIAKEFSPEWQTLVNFAGGVRSNLAADGLNWIELFRSGALTCGLHEDYGAWMKTLQLRSYYMAVMRAACRKNNVIFGPLSCYPGNTPWEFISGSFSQLGQGAKRFSFFNYGPHYIVTSSPCSGIQWVHDCTKFVTHSVGAVEDELLRAEVVPGDAALLLSTTSDLWNTYENENGSFSNLYGMERTFLYLLLRHLQVRPDILPEEELGERLARYKLLFATDSHLKREYVPLLQKWVEDGGILYVGANALAFDEYNQPLALPGVKRVPGKVDQDLKPGRPPYELRRRAALDTVGTQEPFEALFGVWQLSGGKNIVSLQSGGPALVMRESGKGKIFASAVFPAMAYIKQADFDPELPISSVVKYPASGPRDFIRAILHESGVIPAVRCSEPLLEGNLLQQGKQLLLLVSNWSGKPLRGNVQLSGFGKPAANITSLHSRMKMEKNSEKEICISGTFGNGELIVVNFN